MTDQLHRTDTEVEAATTDLRIHVELEAAVPHELDDEQLMGCIIDAIEEDFDWEVQFACSSLSEI